MTFLKLGESYAWANVTGTTILYPSGGAGGTTSTAGSSDLVAAKSVLIKRIVLTAVTASTVLTVANHAGTTLFTISPVATIQPYVIELGIVIPSGWRAVWSGTGSTAMILYADLNPQ